MKLVIMLSCILANGDHLNPTRHYRSWHQCNKRAERMETKRLKSYDGKHPLCWCHLAPESYYMAIPERRQPDDDD